MPTSLSLLLALTLAACSEPPPGPDAGAVDTGSDASCEPAAAAEEEIRVAGVTGELGGTLALPERCGPVPAVILVSGDGSTDRDGNVPGGTGPNLLRFLSEGLVRDAGVAVLRYDDEGVGASASALPSDLRELRLETEVENVVRWVRALRTDGRLSSIILLGHSAGSLKIHLAASRTPVEGLISLAGPGRPVGTILREQLADDLSAVELAALDAAVVELAAGRIPGPLEAPLNELFPEDFQPYLASYFSRDPAEVFRATTARALVVRGTTDWQVALSDLDNLAAARPDATRVEVPEMNHVLKHATDDAASQRLAYGDPSLPLADGLLPALTAFLEGTPR